jgi:hypothetical protein
MRISQFHCERETSPTRVLQGNDPVGEGNAIGKKSPRLALAPAEKKFSLPNGARNRDPRGRELERFLPPRVQNERKIGSYQSACC